MEPGRGRAGGRSRMAGESRLEYPIGKPLVITSTGTLSDAAISPDGKMIAYFEHPNAGDTRGYVAVPTSPARPSG